VLSLLVLGGSLLAAGCEVSLGHDLSMREGHLEVDGVRLEHERWVDAQLDASALASLAIDTASGPIELAGDPAGACALSVHVYSEHEGDGEVYLDGDRLRLRSSLGGKVFLDGVKGTVPQGLALVLGTASGDITLDRAGQGRDLELSTASGDVVVRGSAPESILVSTASGDVLVEATSAASIRSQTASGDMAVKGGAWGTIRGDTASGDLRLQGCSVEAVELSSASGDLVISGGTCQRARLDTASGEVEILDGAKVERISKS
jgi:hypothetical protein